ncbi:MAG: DUF2577 domain-containing protein [Eubacterium sp.]|nr:DUF2577 domain-containing protein [Eubacterium sp.]
MSQDESSATSISELIKTIANGSVSTSDVYEGTVTSADPIKITLVNDAKIVLSSANLVVPEHLRKKTVTFTVAGYTKTITIREALASGDKVYLLTYNNGKKYFVLDRI